MLAQQLAKSPKYRDRIDGEFVRLIYQTSPLHDIGKVAIPDCVLRKPGRLNDAEFAIMKTHAQPAPTRSTPRLSDFPDARFLTVARDIAATHHERWDGTGYPAGLRGEAIPLCGRIVAVADVYDALTSKRCYKEAYRARRREVDHRERLGQALRPGRRRGVPAVEEEFVVDPRTVRRGSCRFGGRRQLATVGG